MSKRMCNLETLNDLQQYGVGIILPSDPRFDVELMNYIGSYNEVIPLVEVAKPLALFIKNNSPKEIIGVSLRWKFVKFNGETTFSRTGESSPGVLMGMQPRDPQMVGKTSLLNSDTVRFFSYSQVAQTIRNINMCVRNPTIDYKFKITSEDVQDTLSYEEPQKNRLLNDVSNISVSADGIIFNDGSFVGDNHNLFFELMNGQIQAKRDFLKKLRKAKTTNKTNMEIINEFLSETNEMRLPVERFVDGEDVFEQSYKGALRNLNRGINLRRTKFSDSVIVGDYLEVQDSDFIPIQRK